MREVGRTETVYRDSGCGGRAIKDRHHSSVTERENEETKFKKCDC